MGLMERMMVIGKIMILSFSDSEENILNKVRKAIEGEAELKYVEEISKAVLSFKDLKIHLKNETVTKNGISVNLSHQEFLALKYLVEHPGWICTKEQIFKIVYGDESMINIENSIYCLIYSLRKKLEINPKHPEYIHTVRGVGYKFIVPDE